MRVLSGLLLLVLVLTGCGTATTTSSDGTSDTQVVAGGEPADLDFQATTLAGEPFAGADLAGKPAVLWFWAPWCPTCRAQIPTVTALGEEYAGRVNVVGVGGLDTQRAIEDLAVEIDHITHLVDDEGVVWKHFGVTAQSTFTVIDADGTIVHEGYLDDGALEDLVATLAG